VHLGDVIEKTDGTIYGDGVNIAARIEGLALPGGVTVSDAVQSAVRHRIAARFEDIGEQHVKNIVDPVRVYRVQEAASAHARAGSAPNAKAGAEHRSLRHWRWGFVGAAALVALAAVALVLLEAHHAGGPGPPAYSFAVLPFEAPAEDRAFADAFTRELTTALARSIYGSTVVSNAAVAGLRDKPVDVKTLGKELDVRYFVEGALRRGDGKVTIDLRLIDAHNAGQLWSEHSETAPAELAEQPELPLIRSTQAVRVGMINLEQRRISKLKDGEASPIELVYRAQAEQGETLESIMRAKALCESALRADPNLAPAMHCVAEMIAEILDTGANPERAKLAAQADELTRKAVAIAPEDGYAWRIRGEALRLRYQWDAALEANARSIQMDPSRTGTQNLRACTWTGSAGPRRRWRSWLARRGFRPPTWAQTSASPAARTSRSAGSTTPSRVASDRSSKTSCGPRACTWRSPTGKRASWSRRKPKGTRRLHASPRSPSSGIEH
jgi:TolB-like protein